MDFSPKNSNFLFQRGSHHTRIYCQKFNPCIFNLLNQFFWPFSERFCLLLFFFISFGYLFLWGPENGLQHRERVSLCEMDCKVIFKLFRDLKFLSSLFLSDNSYELFLCPVYEWRIWTITFHFLNKLFLMKKHIQ